MLQMYCPVYCSSFVAFFLYALINCLCKLSLFKGRNILCYSTNSYLLKFHIILTLDPHPVLKQSAGFIGSFSHALFKAFGASHKINTHPDCTVVINIQCQLIYCIKRDNLVVHLLEFVLNAVGGEHRLYSNT